MIALPERPVVAEYDPRWPLRFREEAIALLDALGPAVTSVEHIGSTAVPGLAAKPMIDLLAGLEGDRLPASCATALQRLGYLGRTRVDRRYFRKGVPRSHFLHLVRFDDAEWRAKLDFRDFLRENDDAAAAYAAKKEALAATGNRAVYAAGKRAFIEEVLASSAYVAFLTRRSTKRSPR